MVVETKGRYLVRLQDKTNICLIFKQTTDISVDEWRYKSFSSVTARFLTLNIFTWIL